MLSLWPDWSWWQECQFPPPTPAINGDSLHPDNFCGHATWDYAYNGPLTTTPSCIWSLRLRKGTKPGRSRPIHARSRGRLHLQLKFGHFSIQLGWEKPTNFALRVSPEKPIVILGWRFKWGFYVADIILAMAHLISRGLHAQVGKEPKTNLVLDPWVVQYQSSTPVNGIAGTNSDRRVLGFFKA